MDGVIYTKTVFGIDELQQRQLGLPPRLRTLLVMVDGKQTSTQLVSTLAPAGITEEHLLQLQDAGLIQPLQKLVRSSADDRDAGRLATLMSIPQPIEMVPPDEAGRLMALQRIYRETIPEVFSGPAADNAGKKLEQAASIRDFISLGNDIISELNTSKRVPLAVAFKSRVKPYLRAGAS